MTNWMHARLEYNPCFPERGTTLVLYRTRTPAGSGDRDPHLLTIKLDNEQLTELVVRAKVKPVDMDGKE